MACGSSVIVSNLASALEWVTDGESGVAIPPKDADALEAAVLRLIGSSDLRERLGARAAEIVRERADHSAHMARMETLMESLLTEWRKRGSRG